MDPFTAGRPISFDTYERIQERLAGKLYAPARKDLSEDFPLRGFVACDDCGAPLTAAWSKGRDAHYAYYACKTKGCPSTRKSIPRADIESATEQVLRKLKPARQLIALARAIFTDLWARRLSQAEEAKTTLGRQIAELETQIGTLLDRIVEATGDRVIQAYESRIEALERHKLRLSDQAAQAVPEKGRFDDTIEPALRFLSNPWNIYEKGDLTLKRTVLKLAFAEPLRYSRETGLRTAKTSFPFRVLGGKSTTMCGLVEGASAIPVSQGVSYRFT